MPGAAGGEADELAKRGEVADLENLSYIPLDIGLDVVAQCLGRIQALLVNARIEPRVQQLLGRQIGPDPARLGHAEREQTQKCRASRKALADIRGDEELLAPGEDVHAVLPRLIDPRLDV